MLLLESSTNTGSEVFTEPCGLNKLLWKEEEEEKKEGVEEGVEEKNEMASLLVTVGREWEWDLLLFFSFLFFYFNQKQRRSAVEKAWRKAKFTWAKGRGGRWRAGARRWGGEGWGTGRDKQTDNYWRTAAPSTSLTERAREEEKEWREREIEVERVHPSYKNGKSTFQRSMEIWSSFHDSIPAPSLFPPSLTTPFPTKLSCFLLQLQFGYKSLLKHRKASKTDRKIAGGRSFGRARGWNKWERKRNARRDVVWTIRSYWAAQVGLLSLPDLRAFLDFHHKNIISLHHSMPRFNLQTHLLLIPPLRVQ